MKSRSIIWSEIYSEDLKNSFFDSNAFQNLSDYQRFIKELKPLSILISYQSAIKNLNVEGLRFKCRGATQNPEFKHQHYQKKFKCRAECGDTLL
jgi:hypothetical protein